MREGILRERGFLQRVLERNFLSFSFLSYSRGRGSGSLLLSGGISGM